MLDLEKLTFLCLFRSFVHTFLFACIHRSTMLRLLMEEFAAPWRGLPKETDQSSSPSMTLDWTVSLVTYSTSVVPKSPWSFDHLYHVSSGYADRAECFVLSRLQKSVWTPPTFLPSSSWIVCRLSTVLCLSQTKPAGTRSSTMKTWQKSCSTLPFVTSTPRGSMKEPTPSPPGEPHDIWCVSGCLRPLTQQPKDLRQPNLTNLCQGTGVYLRLLTLGFDGDTLTHLIAALTSCTQWNPHKNKPYKVIRLFYYWDKHL